MFLVGMALGCLAVGSLVAAAVLIEHLLSTSRFSPRAWWLIPALTIAWPRSVCVWYATCATPKRRTGRGRIGLITTMLVGALGFGWVCGSSLYSLLYPKEPELTDKAAIDALIESIIGGGTNGT